MTARLLAGRLEMFVAAGDLYDGVQVSLELYNHYARHLTLELAEGAAFSLFNRQGTLICEQNIYDLNRSHSFSRVVVKRQEHKRLRISFYLHVREKAQQILSRTERIALDLRLNHKLGPYRIELLRVPLADVTPTAGLPGAVRRRLERT